MIDSVKKSINSIILLVALPCIIILTAALIILFYDDAGSDGLVNYLAVSITAFIIVTVVALIAANIAARKMTDKITASLENNDVNIVNTSMYDELMPFAWKIERQKQDLRSRIEDLSHRTNTIEIITGNMQEGLILIDSDGSILSANNSALRVFGESIERKSIKHIYRDETFQDAVEKCLSGENAEMQIQRDGRIYTVLFSPVVSNANAGGAVILLYDATERHRAEKQRREFSANVSHELKTPLTTISALSEMIAKGMAKEEDIIGFADRITEQSGRLLVLIDDIIRLSEFDEGGVNKEVAVFDLRELAESVINSLRDNAGGVDIQLTGERFVISANSRMIDELLYNLIDNGVKYNNDGGRVTVELTCTEDGFCKISVSDTGIGIREEHHPHIFERFYRAEKSRSKKTGGTGLGLSIVKHITELYNGRTELESKEGGGTTVTCYLNVGAEKSD